MNILSQAIAWLTDPANWQGPNGIPVRLTEHVLISVVSLAIALAVALPIGVWVGHTGRHAQLAVNVANFGRALPSIAVIVIVLPITSALDSQAGFKVYPDADRARHPGHPADPGERLRGPRRRGP